MLFNSFSRLISVYHPYVSIFGILCNFLKYLQISCPYGIPWECILWDRGILLLNITVIKTTHVPTGHPQFFCSCLLQQTCWVWNQLWSHTASCPWLTCVFLSDVVPTLDSVLTLMGLDGEGQCWGRMSHTWSKSIWKWTSCFFHIDLTSDLWTQNSGFGGGGAYPMSS